MVQTNSMQYFSVQLICTKLSNMNVTLQASWQLQIEGKMQENDEKTRPPRAFAGLLATKIKGPH